MSLVLGPISNALVFLSTRVHPSVYPYPWATTLHATRISIAFQANSYRVGTAKTLGWKAWLAGFLVMAWGGTFFSHILLSLPPPPIYTRHPWINYLSIHIFLTFLLSASAPSASSSSSVPTFLTQPSLSTLDLTLFPLDALLRVNAITATLSHLENPSTISTQLVSSPLFHFILGCTASAGGGVSAATLSVWDASWSLSTPVFLRKGPRGVGVLRNAMATVDIWGGGLVATIYGLATAHTAYTPFFLLLSPYIHSLTGVEITESTPLSNLVAKSLGVVVLGVLFGLRVLLARVDQTNVKATKGQ